MLTTLHGDLGGGQVGYRQGRVGHTGGYWRILGHNHMNSHSQLEPTRSCHHACLELETTKKYAEAALTIGNP
jgi:hypothetical protein